MAFLTINSNLPLNLDDPLISFRVRGKEVASLMATGIIQVESVGYPDGSYTQSSVGVSQIDGGNF